MGLAVFDQTVGEDEVNTFQDLTFEEVLEDLSARFIVNLPPEEQELVRVYWQVEQAHWFYEDYVRPLNPHLPSYSQRAFAHLFISQSPYVSEYYDTVEMEKGYDEWMRYKSQVPVCGGILLNEAADKCLLVRGYKNNAAWSFPRGKINLDESEADCAIREVFEETGYDFRALIRPKDFVQCRVAQQTVTLFLVPGVPESTRFETQTRMEIGAIEWVPLADLPTWKKKKGAKADSGKEKKYYMVAPFVGHIKTWVKQYKKTNGINTQAPASSLPLAHFEQSLPVPPPVSRPHEAPPPSALDVLFSRFMTNKRDEEPTPVLQPATPASNKNQDDALERLLNGLAVAPPVVAAPVQPLNPLLALLNGKSPQPSAAAPATDHQSALLALLSPSKRGLQLKPSSADGLASHIADLSREQAQAPASALFADLARGPISPNAFLPPTQSFPPPAKPSSMPTSPRPATDSPDVTKAKQRALLEMMVSGLPPVSMATTSTSSASVASPAHPAGNTAAWVAGLEPGQKLYSAEAPGAVAAPPQGFGAAPHSQPPGFPHQPWVPQPQYPTGPAHASVPPQGREPGMQGYGMPPQQPRRPPPAPRGVDMLHASDASFIPHHGIAGNPPFVQQHPPSQHHQPAFRPPPPASHTRSGSHDLPPHVHQQPFDHRLPLLPQQQRWAASAQQPQQWAQQPPRPPALQNQMNYAQPQARVPASVNNLLAVLNGAPQSQRLQADVSVPGYPTGSPGRPYLH